MGKIRTLGLDESQKAVLEKGHREGKSHAYRNRCQLVLLKEEGRPSIEVASVVKMCEMSVNNWIARYSKEGIAGLLTKPGRGRKPLLHKDKDGAALTEAITRNRQSLPAAKAAFEAAGGSSVSCETLRRFLKVLTADING